MYTKEDAAAFIFDVAEEELKTLPRSDLVSPDGGSRRGVKFWERLAAKAESLAVRYPDMTESIAGEYDRLWSVWKERRDPLPEAES